MPVDPPVTPQASYTPPTPPAAVAPGGSYTPPTPDTVVAPGGSYTPPTPDTVVAPGGSYTPATPPAAIAPGGSYTPPTPPAAVTPGGSYTPPTPPEPRAPMPASTPVVGTPGVAASLTTAFPGANNDLVVTAVEVGTAGNQITFEVDDQAELPVQLDFVAIEVTGTSIVARYRPFFLVTNDDTNFLDSTGFPLPSNGGILFGLPEKTYVLWKVGTLNGRIQLSDASNITVQWTGTKWEMIAEGTGAFLESTEDVATPDLVTTWTQVGSALGNPVYTWDNLTASALLAALEADVDAAALVTVDLASGSNGSGYVAAMAATNLSGGVDEVTGAEAPVTPVGAYTPPTPPAPVAPAN